jgi:hypothetical protein
MSSDMVTLDDLTDLNCIMIQEFCVRDGSICLSSYNWVLEATKANNYKASADSPTCVLLYFKKILIYTNNSKAKHMGTPKLFIEMW